MQAVGVGGCTQAELPALSLAGWHLAQALRLLRMQPGIVLRQFDGYCVGAGGKRSQENEGSICKLA